MVLPYAHLYLRGGRRIQAVDIFDPTTNNLVAPNYRLSPKVTFPGYIQDAAAAVAWMREYLKEYGADPNLGDLGLNTSDIAGLIPVSG